MEDFGLETIADMITSSVGDTDRRFDQERKSEFKDADDYDLSCCPSSKTRAPTSVQCKLETMAETLEAMHERRRPGKSESPKKRRVVGGSKEYRKCGSLAS